MNEAKENTINSVIKTEVKLGENSIRDILTAEVAKVMLKEPDVLNGIIEAVLFKRPTKRYSYDPEKPTLFESSVEAALKPMIKETIIKVAEKHRKKITTIIESAFKTKIIDHKEFKERLMERLATFTQNISFYVDERR